MNIYQRFVWTVAATLAFALALVIGLILRGIL
jgi:hypothetical protein